MSTPPTDNAPAAPAAATAPPQEAAPPVGGVDYWKPCLSIALVFLAIDHLTKWWAMEVLRPEGWIHGALTWEIWNSREVIDIIPGLLRLAYAENTGAAFSILDGQVGLLAVISLVASGALVWFWYSLPKQEAWGRVAVALILSGAVGNMIDRVFRGYVVDFIDAYIGSYHWPTFNIADSCICVGAGILIVRFLQKKI